MNSYSLTNQIFLITMSNIFYSLCKMQRCSSFLSFRLQLALNQSQNKLSLEESHQLIQFLSFFLHTYKRNLLLTQCIKISIKLYALSYSYNQFSFKKSSYHQVSSMDNFEFKTQGVNYDAFRPKYPADLYMKTLNKIGHKNKYIDVAMGTGQLLFILSDFFKKSVGVDPSHKMFQTSLQKLKQMGETASSRIQLRKMEVMDIPSDQKYDLITIGQALHWFPIHASLKKLKDNLQVQGKLLILGYVVSHVQLNKNQKSVSNPQTNNIQDHSYDVFYSKVKPYFDFDRNDLHTNYSDKKRYPFSQVFRNVQKQVLEIKINMDYINYVNYLKTYSGYNQYLLKNKKEEDPIKKIEEGPHDNRVVVFNYFKIQCSS